MELHQAELDEIEAFSADERYLQWVGEESLAETSWFYLFRAEESEGATLRLCVLTPDNGYDFAELQPNVSTISFPSADQEQLRQLIFSEIL